MLGGTRVVSQRLRGCNDDLIGIGPERRDRLGVNWLSGIACSAC
jgi:hypothetical protein